MFTTKIRKEELTRKIYKTVRQKKQAETEWHAILCYHILELHSECNTSA